MRVAALGRTQLLYDSVREIARRGHRVVLIGTSPAAPEYSRREEDFAALAAELGCPFFCDARIGREENLRLIAEAGAEVAVSTNWVSVIPGEVLRMFPHGVVNSHFGDLPRYRGNACPNWAILQGEREIVITLHQMAEELDAGPILMQRPVPLDAGTYVGDVYRYTEEHLAGMYADVVDGLEAGTLTPRPQPADPALALRCYPRVPGDALLAWEHPAEHLARLVRASAEPFGGAFTYLGGARLTVWRARAEPLSSSSLAVPGTVAWIRRESGEVGVLTGDGVLVLGEVQPEGGARQPAAAVVRSARARLGLRLEDEVPALRARVAELEAAVARLEAAHAGAGAGE